MKLWAELFLHIDLQLKWNDEMMICPRLYNVAGIGACKPVLIQPMLMPIIFEHYKQLTKLQDKIFNK
jgi:hypothetical protein